MRTGRLECRGEQVIVVRSLDDFYPGTIAGQWEALRRAVMEPAVPAEDSRKEPLVRRTEGAHGETLRQRAVWLARSRPGGLEDSVDKFAARAGA